MWYFVAACLITRKEPMPARATRWLTFPDRSKAPALSVLLHSALLLGLAVSFAPQSRDFSSHDDAMMTVPVVSASALEGMRAGDLPPVRLSGAETDAFPADYPMPVTVRPENLALKAEMAALKAEMAVELAALEKTSRQQEARRQAMAMINAYHGYNPALFASTTAPRSAVADEGVQAGDSPAHRLRDEEKKERRGYIMIALRQSPEGISITFSAHGDNAAMHDLVRQTARVAGSPLSQGDGATSFTETAFFTPGGRLRSQPLPRS